MDTKPIQLSKDFEMLFEDARTRVKELSLDEVEKLLTSTETFHLIDVRESNEFSKGYIPKAKHLSKGWIEAKIHTVVPNKNEKVVLYCGGGHRSLLAADNLQKMGYKKVYSMHGGIKGWIKNGKSIISK